MCVKAILRNREREREIIRNRKWERENIREREREREKKNKRLSAINFNFLSKSEK